MEAAADTAAGAISAVAGTSAAVFGTIASATGIMRRDTITRHVAAGLS